MKSAKKWQKNGIVIVPTVTKWKVLESLLDGAKNPWQGKTTLNLPSVFPMLFKTSQYMNFTEYLVNYMIQPLLCFLFIILS